METCDLAEAMLFENLDQRMFASMAAGLPVDLDAGRAYMREWLPSTPDVVDPERMDLLIALGLRDG